MIMNILKHWKYFQKTDLDFLHLAYEKQTIVSELTSLNERRKTIQKEILVLSSTNDTCKNCPTSCCRGNYNHFTIVDYIIRMFSDNPLKEFAETQQIPPSLFGLIRERIKRPAATSVSSHSVDLSVVSEPIPTPVSKCLNLTPNGCAFSSQDRPIRCVLYTCSVFRYSLPEKDLEKIGILSKELSEISEEVFHVFTK
jgi:hypothetical protein